MIDPCFVDAAQPKLNLTGISSPRFENHHDDAEALDDNASLGDQTLVTIEEGVRHASHWKIVAMGQLLSFLSASAAAVQAELHLECTISSPCFSISVTFFLLSLLVVPLRKRHCSNIGNNDKPELFGIPLHAPVAVFCMLAIMEVLAQYWTLSAFRYTTMTSITLLDAISLPTVMILSRFLLNRRYIRIQVLAALVCLAGVIVNMLADASEWRHSVQSSYPNKIIGDIYAASGAIMMGVIHIYSQVLVSDTGPMEYLGIVGFFAWPIALIASLIFERNENAYVVHGSTCSTGLSSILLVMSVVTKSLDIAGTASFLYISEATLLNLSLLTTDLWSATFSIIVEGILPSPLFWVALVVVVSGIFLYEMGPSPVQHHQ